MPAFQSAVSVGFDEFAAAAERLPKMKRAPRGAAGIIPRDTNLLPDSQGIVVETPAVASLVVADRPWEVSVAVESRRLVAVCTTLKKLGAAGQAIEVGIRDRELWLKFRTTAISVPTLRAETGSGSASPEGPQLPAISVRPP
jgi:hypothetical protein